MSQNLIYLTVEDAEQIVRDLREGAAVELRTLDGMAVNIELPWQCNYCHRDQHNEDTYTRHIQYCEPLGR